MKTQNIKAMVAAFEADEWATHIAVNNISVPGVIKTVTLNQCLHDPEGDTYIDNSMSVKVFQYDKDNWDFYPIEKQPDKTELDERCSKYDVYLRSHEKEYGYWTGVNYCLDIADAAMRLHFDGYDELIALLDSDNED